MRARLAAAEATLRAEGAGVETAVFDVADAAATTAGIDAVLAGGPLDIVVNNAGVNRRQPLDAFSDAEWRAVLAANLDGPFHVARAVLPGMKARGRGKLINICSMASEIGRPNIVPYAASKGGLQMFTRALAVEVAPFGIQVNGIAPGFFATAMNAGLTSDADFDAWVRRRTPAGRWGEPAEVVRRRGIPRLRCGELRDGAHPVRRRRVQRRLLGRRPRTARWRSEPGCRQVEAPAAPPV